MPSSLHLLILRFQKAQCPGTVLGIVKHRFHRFQYRFLILAGMGIVESLMVAGGTGLPRRIHADNCHIVGLDSVPLDSIMGS